jgi:hypothetical protein
MEQLHEPSDETSRVTSFSSVAQELTESIKDVIRSEVNLAKAELKVNGSQLTHYGIRMAIFGAFALLGIFPLLSFLVIGLGKLLNGNYWLSSLIWAVVMFTVGGIVAYAMFKRIKQVNLRFDNTRDSLALQLKTVDRKIAEVKDIAKARASIKHPRRASS